MFEVFSSISTKCVLWCVSFFPVVFACGVSRFVWIIYSVVAFSKLVHLDACVITCLAVICFLSVMCLHPVFFVLLAFFSMM